MLPFAIQGATADNLIPGGAFAALVGLVGYFIRWNTKDRGGGYDLAAERKADNLELREQLVTLERQCADERLAHARELADIADRHSHEVSGLRSEILDQRKLKHDAVNRATVAELLVHNVRRLAVGCTCGALDVVQRLLDEEA